MEYTTNIDGFDTIKMTLPIEKGSIISIAKTDPTGYMYPVLFTVTGKSGNYVELKPLVPIYGKVLSK